MVYAQKNSRICEPANLVYEAVNKRETTPKQGGKRGLILKDVF